MDIVVLAGGLSDERNVSLVSGAKICRALRERGHRAVLVDMFLGLEDCPLAPGALFKNLPPLPDGGVAVGAPDLDAVRQSRRDQGRSLFGRGVLELCERADVVFLGLHGACGEDGRVQAAFDLMGIPYTGSGYRGSAIAMDKDFTKRLARDAGVPTPDWQTVCLGARPAQEIADTLALPCVVKVPDGGSSIGVYLCHDRAALVSALDACAGQAQLRVVVERYVRGREFSCGVLDGTGLPSIEIIPKDGFYNYENKYQVGAATEVCPAEVPPEIEAAMRGYALQMHQLLGLRTYSRSDFILDETGEGLFFLEINTLPGMTPTSLLPQEAAAAGIDYETLCQRIVDAARKERWQ